MSREEVKTAFLALPSAKLVSSIATRIAKENKRFARQDKNEKKTYKTAIRRSKKEALENAVSTQRVDLGLLSSLPCSSLYPVTTTRELVVKQRAKFAKRAKDTPKRRATAKAKAVRIRTMQEVRFAKKRKAEYQAYLIAEQASLDAERAAFIAAKEAEPPMMATFVDCIDQVKILVDEVSSLSDPVLYLDAEGISLSRDGDMVFLQMHIDAETGPHTFVIDVWTLKNIAFQTPGVRHPNTTFKSLLENPSIPKLFWDCRMDSDALYAQFQIALTGVLDLQLMEVARRPRRQSLLCIKSYGYGVSEHAGLDWWDTAVMQRAKRAKNLFIPRFGGSWDALTTRPLRKEILDYCAGDVRYMPALFRNYARYLREKDISTVNREAPGGAEAFPLDQAAHFFGENPYRWAREVVVQSAERIRRSQAEGWDRKVVSMTASPWGHGQDYWDYSYHSYW